MSISIVGNEKFNSLEYHQDCNEPDEHPCYTDRIVVCPLTIDAILRLLAANPMYGLAVGVVRGAATPHFIQLGDW